MNGLRVAQIVVLIIGLAVLLLGFGLLAPAGGFGPRFTETKERAFSAAATHVDIQGFHGGITYESWDGQDIVVEATWWVSAWTEGLAKRLVESVEVRFQEEGGRVRAEAGRPSGLLAIGNLSANFVVRVPEGWAGDVTLTTRNGKISARDVKGDAVLRTSNGAVVVRDTEGALDVRTSNGRIDVAGARGSVRVTTSNGSVRIADAVLSGNGVVRTSNGAVDVTARLTNGAGYDVTTSNGSVTLTLVEPDAEVDLRTSNGRIVLQTEVLASRVDRRHVAGRIGPGAARLHVRTSNGSISLGAAP